MPLMSVVKGGIILIMWCNCLLECFQKECLDFKVEIVYLHLLVLFVYRAGPECIIPCIVA